MSEYEIGKAIENLISRVNRIESELEEMTEIANNGIKKIKFGSFQIEKSEIVSNEGVKIKRMQFGTDDEDNFSSMRYLSTLVNVYSNGDWDSTCKLINESGHRNWRNNTLFYLSKSIEIEQIKLLDDDPFSWSKLIKHGTEKTCKAKGNSSQVKKEFERIWNLELGMFRYWWPLKA